MGGVALLNYQISNLISLCDTVAVLIDKESERKLFVVAGELAVSSCVRFSIMPTKFIQLA